MPAQQEVIAFLENPAHHRGADSVRRIDTHSAYVFLAGDLAYKLKRAVTYDFLDFSTVEKRRAACQAEIVINRRTAPGVYLRAEPITRDATGRMAIGGGGDPVDWVVVMRRFDEDGLFDRLAARHALSRALVLQLADEVRRLHSTAEVRTEFGGAGGMLWVVDRNAVVFDELADILPAALGAEVTAASRDAIHHYRSLLETRRASGHVRQCHGDLHLRNIVLIDGRPVIFDAIEFNDRIACTDVLYDLAFLVMDLLQFGLPDHASTLFNRYLERSDELEGLPMMPLFLSCRAAVRAKVTGIEARLVEGANATRDKAQACAYLEQARSFLKTTSPRVIAIGGFSGTGKTTLAARLAPGMGAAPGAVVVRSDVVRKGLFGWPPEHRLGPEAYAPEVSRRVYDELCRRTRLVIEAGYSVIVDAVFAAPESRAAVKAVAGDLGTPFTGLWLQAPYAEMQRRVATRLTDASDATVLVIDRQLSESTGEIDWRRIDAGQSEAVIEDSARALISG